MDAGVSVSLRQGAAIKALAALLVLEISGGLRSLGVQAAKLLGARVIAGAGSNARMRMALALGADAGIDYGTQDLVGEVLRLTDGRGVDVVFDNIGILDCLPVRCRPWHGMGGW